MCTFLLHFLKTYNFLFLISNIKIMSRLSTVKEIFELFVNRRKFHMFPILVLLIALIGVTALAQSGLVAFIYPI
jgi:hypothetical protein